MGNYRVNGPINSGHKWLTVIHYREFTSIVSWYTLPREFILTLEDFGLEVSVLPLNQDPVPNPKCWACGTPVEQGERFCNDECKKAINIEVQTDEK